MQTRPYQQHLIDAIVREWDQGRQNVMPVLATGGGKSHVVGRLAAMHDGAGLAMAHRVELLGQLSIALAREGVRHNLIGPKAMIRAAVRAQIDELGRSYYDPSARWHVGGVDTLVRMDERWMDKCSMLLGDEGHHYLAANKWGTVVQRINARYGALPTATPERADGKGLGRHAHGVADALVEGPAMRWLIESGFLCDYRIICPDGGLDLSHAKVGSSGDFTPDAVRSAVRKSHVVGDVVAHYLRWAAGKQGVTFTADVEDAMEIAGRFRAAGVRAEVLSGKTGADQRVAIMRRFRAREIQQLVNCEVLGEGVDVPAIEVVSFARPTQSFSLFCQQFGRALRPLPGKDRALILDHVGNVARLGLPDAQRVWTLDARSAGTPRGPTDAIPLRICINETCLQPYERIHPACPHCGTRREPSQRSGPEHVDGDLTELSPEVLRAMRGEVARIDGPARLPQGVAPNVAGAIKRTHTERQAAQAQLRHAIGVWAAVHDGADDATNYRRFYHTFGTDVLSAQALGRPEAVALRERIERRLAASGYLIPSEGLAEPSKP